jgi:hypothetical protein
MIRNLFRRPNREEELYAEAQALVDDGLDLDFVLALYPDDAEWLAPLLDTGVVIGETYAAEEPSFYFEASLKNRFINAGMEKAARAHEPVREPVAAVAAGPAAGVMRLQSVMAGTAVAVILGATGVMTLGLVTSGDSVPGDWNYAFKLAGERIEYSLSSGDERIDIQLNHVQTRVQELQKLSERGEVSQDVLQKFRHELEEVNSLQRNRPLDPLQQASVKAIGEGSIAVLDEVAEQEPELVEDIESTRAVAAGLGGATVTVIDEPTPTPSPTETATSTATASETAEPSASAEPTGEGSEEPSSTEQPVEAETEEPAE